MTIKNQYFLLLAFSFVLFSCQQGIGQNTLKPEDFKDKLEKLPDAVIVDVRTPSEFMEGHLPKALNVDVKNSEFENNVRSMDTTKTYMLYCRSGGRTHQAAEIMRSSGFKNVYEMQGGFPDWKSAGYPVEK